MAGKHAAPTRVSDETGGGWGGWQARASLPDRSSIRVSWKAEPIPSYVTFTCTQHGHGRSRPIRKRRCPVYTQERRTGGWENGIGHWAAGSPVCAGEPDRAYHQPLLVNANLGLLPCLGHLPLRRLCCVSAAMPLCRAPLVVVLLGCARADDVAPKSRPRWSWPSWPHSLHEAEANAAQLGRRLWHIPAHDMCSSCSAGDVRARRRTRLCAPRVPLLLPAHAPIVALRSPLAAVLRDWRKLSLRLPQPRPARPQPARPRPARPQPAHAHAPHIWWG